MKNRLMRAITSVCTFAIALTPFFHTNTSSFIFFGEPEYPCKEDYTK